MPLTQEELAILVTGKDVSATRTLRGVSREADKFGRELGAIGGRAGRNFARNLERTLIVGATAAAGAIGYSVKAAGDFEAQLNTINTIARAGGDAFTGELGKIGDQIRQIARDTGTPLEELTAGYYDLLSAGIDAADAQNVLLASNRLAIGGLASTAETVDLLTTAINTYGGDATQAARYADVFAKAVERGKVTAADIASTFAGVGPLAASMGIEIEEIAAGYARMTANGTSAGEAQTQMTAALNAFLKKTGPLEALEKQTGRNYAAIAGRKGLAFAYEQLRKDADKAGVSLGDVLGRKEALLYLLQVTGPNFDAYNEDLAAMGDAAGTAAEQMAERQQGLNYQLGRLKANVQDAAITIGAELLPVFADLAAEGTKWILDHQPEIAQFAKDLRDGIRDAVEYAKDIDWDAIAAALGTGADAAKTIASAFLALPPEMKGLLVGGFVVNKATGGAVTDVLGLTLKTALSQFASRGSSPANPLFVVPIGGGLGGGAGALGGAAGGGRFGVLGPLLRFAGLGAGLGITAQSNAAQAGGGVSPEGYFGNIGGSALAGAAIAGPLGALAGGLTGIAKSVAEVQSQRNTEQAQAIHQTLSQSLAGPNTVADLQMKLGAIDKGIADIQSQPLNFLYAGESLAQLQQMRSEVVAEIDALGPQIGGLSLEERDAAAAQAAANLRSQAAIDATRDAVEANRIATVSAIQRKDLSVTVHNTTKVDVDVPLRVTVSGARQQASANYQSRERSTSETRYDTGHGHLE